MLRARAAAVVVAINMVSSTLEILRLRYMQLAEFTSVVLIDQRSKAVAVCD